MNVKRRRKHWKKGMIIKTVQLKTSISVLRAVSCPGYRFICFKPRTNEFSYIFDSILINLQLYSRTLQISFSRTYDFILVNLFYSQKVIFVS